MPRPSFSPPSETGYWLLATGYKSNTTLPTPPPAFLAGLQQMVGDGLDLRANLVLRRVVRLPGQLGRHVMAASARTTRTAATRK